MKTQQTPDGIVWEQLPNPLKELVNGELLSIAFRSRAVAKNPSTFAVYAPAAFWRRLAQNLVAVVDRPVARAHWETLLTDQAVEYLAAFARLEADITASETSAGTVDIVNALPAEAIQCFGKFLRTSLEPSTARLICKGKSGSSLQLILPNGAIAILRPGARGLTLQDCYFPHAIIDSMPKNSGEAAASTDMARSLVIRYARLDADERAFVLPSFEENVIFMNPAAWGFEANRVESQWHGMPTSKPSIWTDLGARLIERFDPAEMDQLADRLLRRAKSVELNRVNSFDEKADSVTNRSVTPRPDAAACLPNLYRAMKQLDTIETAREAAPTGLPLQHALYRLAQSLGYCRLFGVILPGQNALLSVSRQVLPLVIRELIDRLDRWSKTAPVGSVEPGREARSLSMWAEDERAFSLLEARLEAWAVYTEIEQVMGTDFIPLDESPASPSMDNLLTALESFDATLLASQSTRCPTPTLIANIRTLLAPRFRECLPWWLGESLNAPRFTELETF